MTIHYKETMYGFEYGSLKIERKCHDKRIGWVYIGLETQKSTVHMYATKSGKTRFFDKEGKELYLKYEP